MQAYQPKVALVHDDFVQEGGAERLFAAIAELYPEAPIYTSIVDWNKLPRSIDRDRIKTSFIQNLAFAKKWYKLFLPLYPFAFESFDFSNYDLVISSTTRFAKAIITKSNAIHICYINSVPRFLWDQEKERDYLPGWILALSKPYFKWLRRWDKAASSRVDFYIANSQNVKSRIKRIYNREVEIVYPFIDASVFKPAKIHKWSLKSQDYYLVVSRLVKWKKIEIAIEAAKELEINLKIVGTGPDENRLKKQATGDRQLANGKVEFLGRVDQKTLIELYQNAKGLLVTQDEDFGIAAVEAQACDCPVIAPTTGGTKEIIINGQTGLLFSKQSSQSLKDAITRSSLVKWKVSVCRKNALRFSKSRFEKNLKRIVSSNLNRKII